MTVVLDVVMPSPQAIAARKSLGLALGSESVKVATTTLMNARPATAATGCATGFSVAAVLVSAKLAGVVTPATEAVTVYAPDVVSAVAVTAACPLAMTTEAAASAAEAPVVGAA